MVLIPNKEIEELMLDKVYGEVIGLVLKEDLKFVLEKQGLIGLKKVEVEMERLGYPLEYNRIKIFQWYPEKMNLVLFVIQKTFNWSDEKIREMGSWSARRSLLIKLAMKYFVSLEKITKETGKIWRKVHSHGDLEIEELNKEKRFFTLVLKNFNTIHPVHCRYLEGYIKQVSSYVLPEEILKIEETECVFKGGRIHKFKIFW